MRFGHRPRSIYIDVPWSYFDAWSTIRRWWRLLHKSALIRAGALGGHCPVTIPKAVDHRWSLDFASKTTTLELRHPNAAGVCLPRQPRNAAGRVVRTVRGLRAPSRRTTDDEGLRVFLKKGLCWAGLGDSSYACGHSRAVAGWPRSEGKRGAI